MQLSTIITASTLLLPSLAKNVYGDGYSRLDFEVQLRDAEVDSYHAKRLLVKRDDEGDNETSPIILQDLLNFFNINVTFGTPGQEVFLALGTGTSDTWVYGKENPYCESSSASSMSKRSFNREVIGDEVVAKNKEVNKAVSGSATGTSTVPRSSATILCSKYGTFDRDASESYTSNDTTFQVYYSDRTYALGEWGTDTMKVGNFELEDYYFGFANTSTVENGILGLGFEDGEGTNRGFADPDRNYTYTNFPSRLKQDGYIHKKVFSLYLDSYNSSTGSVLFGAIDHAKYSGSLVTLPVINTYEQSGIPNASYFVVTVSGVGTDVNGNQTTFSSNKYPAAVDSATTLTYLPSRFMDEVAEAFNATYSYYNYAYVMRCPTLEESLSQFLVIDLSGHKIRVPLYQLIRGKFSQSQCVLGLRESPDGTITLGASFLRSVYAVFDLEEYEISFAQARYTEDENIEVIQSTVPSATRAPEYSNTWSTYEYATTTNDIFSDEDDNTTAVDVFGYTGGDLDATLSVRGQTTSSGSAYGAPSSGRTSYSRTRTRTSSASIGRSTVRAEGSTASSFTASSSATDSEAVSGTGTPQKSNATDNFAHFHVIPVILSVLLTMVGLFML